MPNREDIAWFKNAFATRIQAAIASTPFTLDFLVALACQETGEVWPRLRRARLGEERLLALCVGDSLDSRSAFPRSRAELEAWAAARQREKSPIITREGQQHVPTDN